MFMTDMTVILNFLRTRTRSEYLSLHLRPLGGAISRQECRLSKPTTNAICWWPGALRTIQQPPLLDIDLPCICLAPEWAGIFRSLNKLSSTSSLKGVTRVFSAKPACFFVYSAVSELVSLALATKSDDES